MLVAPKFTPEVLIEEPRRGAAVPNHDGTLALYTVSTHTIGKGTLKEVRVMNIETGDSAQISDSSEVHDAHWLGDSSNAIIYLKSGEKGATSIMIANADEPSKDPYVVEEIPAPVKYLKTKELDDGSIAFAVVGLVDTNGNLFNEETVDIKSTVRVYDTYQTRFVSAPPGSCLSNFTTNERGCYSGTLTSNPRGIPSGILSLSSRVTSGHSLPHCTTSFPDPILKPPKGCMTAYLVPPDPSTSARLVLYSWQKIHITQIPFIRAYQMCFMCH